MDVDHYEPTSARERRQTQTMASFRPAPGRSRFWREGGAERRAIATRARHERDHELGQHRDGSYPKTCDPCLATVTLAARGVARAFRLIVTFLSFEVPR